MLVEIKKQHAKELETKESEAFEAFATKLKAAGGEGVGEVLKKVIADREAEQRKKGKGFWAINRTATAAKKKVEEANATVDELESEILGLQEKLVEAKKNLEEAEAASQESEGELREYHILVASGKAGDDAECQSEEIAGGLQAIGGLQASAAASDATKQALAVLLQAIKKDAETEKQRLEQQRLQKEQEKAKDQPSEQTGKPASSSQSRDIVMEEEFNLESNELWEGLSSMPESPEERKRALAKLLGRCKTAAGLASQPSTSEFAGLTATKVRTWPSCR